ncbi:hypothetical protein YWS52_36110 [Chitiniphilus shinanonensis]
MNAENVQLNLQRSFNKAENLAGVKLVDVEYENTPKEEEILKVFQGKSWEEVDSELLLNKEGIIRCLSAPAFCYYIASYINFFFERSCSHGCSDRQCRKYTDASCLSGEATYFLAG